MQWIESCIKSVVNSSVATQVVVVDNRSTDGTPDFIKKEFPNVIVLENDRNLGFGQANNMGIQYAMNNSAEYVFLLNQDARIFSDTLLSLVEGFEKFQNIGIVSPVHLDGSGKNFDELFFQYLGKSDLKPFLLQKILHGNEKKLFVQTRFVNAAAWLVSVKCLKDIGLFDTLFFHYGEDRNLCHRVVYRGYGILIATDSFICHDRDSRLRKTNLSGKAKIRKELTGFLVDASNIRRSNINWFIFKRILRYGLLAVVTAITLQFKLAFFNAAMAVGILKNWVPIIKSRNRSFKGGRQLVPDRNMPATVDWA